MLTRLLHWLVSHPAIYDAAMYATGSSHTGTIVRGELARCGLHGLVVEIGGGTGLLRPHLPAAARYVCLDNDPLKLAGYRRRFPSGAAVFGDATKLPIQDGSLDAVLCGFMAHHLDDREVDRMMDEASRALKPGGHFVLIDPLFEKYRLPGRILWRYDRGRHPRTLDVHRRNVERRFPVIVERRFSVFHAYGLIVGQKQTSAGR